MVEEQIRFRPPCLDTWCTSGACLLLRTEQDLLVCFRLYRYLRCLHVRRLLYVPAMCVCLRVFCLSKVRLADTQKEYAQWCRLTALPVVSDVGSFLCYMMDGVHHNLASSGTRDQSRLLAHNMYNSQGLLYLVAYGQCS